MMHKRNVHPDQGALEPGRDAELERMIEARVAIRAEADAMRWRFRLILIETVIIANLVLGAGLVLGQPPALVIGSAALVGMACLASGLLLILLSGLAGHLSSLWQRWRQ